MKGFIRRVREVARSDTKAALAVAMPLPASVDSAPAQAPATEQSPYVGYIDKIGAGQIIGWAASRTDLDAPVRVRLYLDGHLCAAGMASLYRADVEAAEFGNGHHGFDLPVPKRALICAERLTLAVDAEDGTEVVCEERLLRQPVLRSNPALFLDASDLIEFLTHHRELSGIQRVQAGYLMSLGGTEIAGTTCRICTRFKTSSFYFEVPANSFALLMRQAGDLRLVGKSSWAAHVRTFKESLTTRALFARGDTVFTLGAPWALDDHNETIRCSKLHDGARYMQIFYDLIPISMPEVVAAPLIPRFARAMAAMATYADHVFSISRYSQDDLAQTLTRLGRPVPETSVVPMGGTITDAEGVETAPAEALERLGVEGPFVLCVGTLEPRKNHALLFQVWRKLVAEHGAENVPRLVLVGRVGWYMEDFLRQLKITGFVDGTVMQLQGVSNAELSELYDGCLFTVFPSFSEGWGLPITESLARGKICVCSNVTSMPEAGGNHALYIDPFDTTAAFNLCDRLIYEPEYRMAEQAKLNGFTPPSWSEATEGLREQLAELLPRLASRPPPPRKPIELGRTYRFYDLEAALPDATAPKVFGNFLDQEDALDLLVGWNWFDLDVNCAWACGPEAELKLCLPADVGEVEVYVGLNVPPLRHECIFELLIDGTSRGTSRVKAGSFTLIVPLVRIVEEHRLLFKATNKYTNATDPRLLGLGISSVVAFRRSSLEQVVRMVDSRDTSRLELREM